MTSTALTSLATCERVIARGQKTFIEVGQALKAIRDQRFYKQKHKTFEEYCKKRWDYGKSYAYDLIKASETSATADKKSQNEDTPKTEREARRMRQATRQATQPVGVFHEPQDIVETPPEEKSRVKRYLAAIKEFKAAVHNIGIPAAKAGEFSPEAQRFIRAKHAELTQASHQLEASF